MRKKLRTAALVFVGLLLLAAVGMLVLYRASRQVPEFYRQAIEDVDPIEQRQASDELLRQASALVSDTQNENRWEAVFTVEQINGWLAVDLAENHAEALPKMLSDPRVAIDGDEMTLACRYRQRGMTSVLTLTVEPYVPEPNVLAVRIRKARAGYLPVPLGSILDRIAEAAGKEGFRLQWRQTAGDPVARFTLATPSESSGKHVQIETLQLADGKLYVAGSSNPAADGEPSGPMPR